MVALIEASGKVLGVSTTLLGLTLVAWGNSAGMCMCMCMCVCMCMCMHVHVHVRVRVHVHVYLHVHGSPVKLE